MASYKRIPRAFIDELLARVNIIDIISPRLALKKKGNNYTANCPFHLEKTPSFSVSEPKQFYHCFGCGVHGNAIDFLIAYDRLEFVEAIETLAAHAGFQIPRELAESNTPPDYADTCQNLSLSAEFYHKQLLRSQKAVDYLKSRGLSKEIVKKYHMGYAPPGWNDLVKFANIEQAALPSPAATRHPLSNTLTRSFGAPSPASGRGELAKTYEGGGNLSGLIRGGMLIKKPQGGFYDRFRDRIMFPIRDSRGQVIAFGGRTLGDDTPKYLNSPETSVFHKGKELYGLYEARQAPMQPKNFIVVEGYMDVIALAQNGFSNAVATLGTAVSREHIQKLLRHAQELFFCFDGDRAGRQAAWRALEVSLPLLRDDLRLRFVFLDPEDDPDTLIRREGPAGFQSKLDQALSLPDFFFSELTQQANPEGLDGRSHLAKLATQLLNKMPSGIFKQLMYDELAKRVQMDVESLISAGEKFPSLYDPLEGNLPRPKQGEGSSINIKRSNALQLALSLLLQHPELAQKLNENEIQALDGDNHSPLLVKVIQLLKKNPNLNTGALLEYWRGRDNAGYLAELAVWPHLLPGKAINEEFLGAIARIKNQHREQRIEILLKKAKTTELLPEEKQNLQKLILEKNASINS